MKLNISDHDLIERLKSSTARSELEELADEACDRDLRGAVPALIERLKDSVVEGDRDVEEAFCSALVHFDVMRCEGNLSFRFQPGAIRDLLGGGDLMAGTRLKRYL